MANGTVLLVDDEPVVLQLHAAAVRHFGFSALLAETAEEGLEMVQKYEPDLIVSDVQMPGEGGFDFIETLVKQGMKTMPAIYLTGYDDIDIIRGGLRAGGDDFIIKGVPVEVMRQKIAFWMASGFQSLPADLRRRALTQANNVVGDEFPGIITYFNRQSDLKDRVRGRLLAEMENLSDTFGKRLIERVCLMARLAKVLIEESAEFGDFIRFPETMFEVVRSLDVPWADSMVPLYSAFDDWASDDRFGVAGVSPLNETNQYNWY